MTPEEELAERQQKEDEQAKVLQSVIGKVGAALSQDTDSVYLTIAEYECFTNIQSRTPEDLLAWCESRGLTPGKQWDTERRLAAHIDEP